MRITAENAGALYAQTLSGAQGLSGAQSLRGAEKNQSAGSAFDQIDISQTTSGQSRFQKEMAARLVQDVRASASTGTIQQLRDQVRGGSYQLDAASIASAMLLGG